MEPIERTFDSADGSPLPVRLWRPLVPRAALLYLHGIQSHSGWYAASSRRLAEAGVAVYQLERRGSGADSAHQRGHVDRAETWLGDVAAAAEVVRGETGFPTVHLAGVSWGGKLALAAAAHRPHLYRSLVLASPGIFPKIDAVLIMKLRVVKALVAGRPLTRFPIPLADPHLFTENPDRVRYIAADPLSLRQVTARFMFESRRLDRLARRAARAVRTPTFLALAALDRIIDNHATRALVQRMPADCKRVVQYPGAHHTLEFEPDPEPFFRDLVAWIDRVQAAAG